MAKVTPGGRAAAHSPVETHSLPEAGRWRDSAQSRREGDGRMAEIADRYGRGGDIDFLEYLVLKGEVDL